MASRVDLYGDDAARSRATSSGFVWLNGIFRFPNSVRHLLGDKGPRVSKIEAVWAVICGILTAVILATGYFILGDWGPLWFFFNPFLIFIWTGVALFFGRRVAHMSPLRRQTGEGSGVWVIIMMRRLVLRVSHLFTRPTMYNRCISLAGSKDLSPKVEECIEYVGTALSPRAPYNEHPKELEDDLVDLYGPSVREAARMVALRPVPHDRYRSYHARDFVNVTLPPRGERVLGLRPKNHNKLSEYR